MPGKRAATRRGEFRIVFDGRDAHGRDGARDQGLGYHAGAGTELQHGAFDRRIDLRRHGAGERWARRRDGADIARARDQPAQESQMIGGGVFRHGSSYQICRCIAAIPVRSLTGGRARPCWNA
jgi:hypothetical protein